MLLSELTSRLGLSDDAETERVLISLAKDDAVAGEVGQRVNRMRAYNRRLDADGEMIKRQYHLPDSSKPHELVAVADGFDL